MSTSQSPRPQSSPGFSRRTLLRYGAGALAAGATFGVRRAAAFAPSDELRVASVGVGGMGGADLSSVAAAPKVRIVALCDVDSNNLGAASKKFSAAKTFSDYRRLLDELHGEIDAVTVSTPDHMHGAISMAAMSLGKHVYVQKPLAHNLAELRRMGDMATEKGVVTQMGTQVHGFEAYRTAVNLLREGAIGKVREAHLWVGRVWSGPAAGRPAEGSPPPESLDWDLWLGVAPKRPFAPGLYHQENWRGWRDFGTGTLGDMACHLFDPLFTALELKSPVEVISRGEPHREETFAPDSDVTYTFAGTPYTAEQVTFRWVDGARRPDVARAQFPADMELPSSGSFVIGEKGVMLLPHYGMPSFYRDGKPLEVEIKSAGAVDHYQQWTNACRGEGATSTPFSYGCVVTEAVLTGVVAGSFRDQPLRWNTEQLSFDHAPANELVHRTYRDGWKIAGL